MTTTRVSYEGLTVKELRDLHKQWKKAAGGRVRCEVGHDRCGASSEASLDGQAPCARELLYELAWRGLIDVNEVTE